ncbi:unnamed protein product [Rhizoctonia solani]|uniref:Transmembrane protein n=1 Tax=Rhizoctonia solani TaxID=456999 RepID=A0A8H3HMJ1_9AGAM|nr:unnamed protein product [Rhizoctonia solani]
MLLALPIIAVAVASYIQFAFIGRDGFGVFRPLTWNALEDLKGIMRRRMPSWMQPISAGVLKLTLSAPIPTNDLPAATSNQTLTVVTPPEISKSYFNDPLFGIPTWIVFRSQEIQGTYFFDTLCGVVAFLCLAGIYVFWTRLMTLTSKAFVCDGQQKRTGEPKSPNTMHSVAHPLVSMTGTLDSVSELISLNSPATGLHDSALGTADISGSISPRLPIASTVPELRFDPLVLSSSLPPATTSQPVWDELRVSPIESPNEMDVDLSRYWHREVMVMEGVPFITNRPRTAPGSYGQWNAIGSGPSSTGLSRTGGPNNGLIYATPGWLSSSPRKFPDSQVPVVPRVTVGEYQEPSKAPTVDCCTCVEKPDNYPSGTRPLQDVSTSRGLAMDISAEGSLDISGSTFGEPRPIPSDSIASMCVSTIQDSSGDSTLSVIPETEYSETPRGDTPYLLHTQVDSGSREGDLVPASTTSAPWVGLDASNDSLVQICSSPATRNIVLDETRGATPLVIPGLSGVPLVNHLDHDNAWTTHIVNGAGLESLTDHTAVDRGALGKGDPYIYSECMEHLRTSSISSTSIGWMSQCSASTHPGTPLITPSNSLPSVVQLDESLYPKVSPNEPGSTMDFLFEKQLSQASSLPSSTQGGSFAPGANTLDSFAELKRCARFSTIGPMLK